jgi:O-6-methylguanine DNA methyltransferase
MSESLFYTTYPSAIGELLLVGNARGLHFIRLLEVTTAEEELVEAFPSEAVTRLDGFFDGAKAAIEAYFNEGVELTLPYHLAGGTPLQRAVWLAMAKIPYGETISYSTLADRVGFPRAVRAVASACGANPVPLAIPCHRVVAKDGTLGGFSLGGIHVKEKLLAVESAGQSVAA